MEADSLERGRRTGSRAGWEPARVKVEYDGSRGERRLNCKFYDLCLSKAIARGWPGFSCHICIISHLAPPLRVEDLELPAPGWEEIWGESLAVNMD